MEEARWTRGFTWFGLPERNTLRPRRECCIAVCMVLFKLGVKLAKRVYFNLSSARSFYSSRSDSYTVTLGSTVGPGEVESLCTRVLMVRGSK
jgi:hypothetical protein